MKECVKHMRLCNQVHVSTSPHFVEGDFSPWKSGELAFTLYKRMSMTRRDANHSGGWQDAVPEDQQKEELMESISKGNFTLRILYEQLANIQKMGPVGQVMSMIPGLNNTDLFNKVTIICAFILVCE